MARLLIISPTPTHPTTAGNRTCILSYSEMLVALGYEVHFLWIYDHNSTSSDVLKMRDYWGDRLIEFKCGWQDRVGKLFHRNFRFRFTGNYNVDDFFPSGLVGFVKDVQAKLNADCFLVNYVFLSRLFDFFPNTKKVLYTHDVFTDKYRLTGSEWFSLSRAEEKKGLDRADVILSIQEEESAFYRSLTDKKVLTSFSVFPLRPTAYSGTKNILYLGGPNSYNIEGLLQFIDGPFIEAVKSIPGLTLLVGGSICKFVKDRVSHPSVKFVGEVDDLFSFYSLGDICVNPTFRGTGLKIKTFEALAFGKVLICDPHNAIGIFDKENAPLLIASKDSDYIKHISGCFSNIDFIREKQKEGIAYIERLNKLVAEKFKEAID